MALPCDHHSRNTTDKYLEFIRIAKPPSHHGIGSSKPTLVTNKEVEKQYSKCPTYKLSSAQAQPKPLSLLSYGPRRVKDVCQMRVQKNQLWDLRNVPSVGILLIIFRC